MPSCPDCGEDAPGRFRFCGYCGARLDRSAGAEELRKTVTVIFCDLKGSTSLGERLDSEALREVLGIYFSAMRRVIERHGGTVEKYIGDAIMAVFGLPALHEDDALRAVRAASDMRAALKTVNVRLQAAWGVQLENRTGVNTGQVVAGDAAAGQRLATGDVVNVAARLEQAAPAGEVLIGEATYRLVRDAVTAERVQPLELKGKSERVPAYRMTGISSGEVRRGQDLPMVGRQAELGVLLEAVKRGPGRPACRVVTVLGQAGLGKTRLIDEFARRVGDGAHVVRGRCLSYGEGITFWPVAEVLRQAAGIFSDDSEEEALAKVVALAGPGRADAARRVGSLMGINPGSFGKEEVFWGVRTVLEAAARRRPLVVVFEDIHWAEQMFLDLVEYVADTSAGVPLLIVCAARTELLDEHPGFLDGRDHASRVELPDLSRAEAAAVIGNLAGGLRLPSSLEDRILAAAGGNPLFIEHMISVLIDSGVVAKVDGRWELATDSAGAIVPPTVASLLGARLDRLAPLERAVLERAAVIGLEFQAGAVQALAAGAEASDLGPALRTLCDKRLIRVVDVAQGEDQYQFTNLLVRDTAYERLLKRTRARMHERCADWLLLVGAGRRAEVEEIVGYHLEQSFRYREGLGPVDEQARSLGDRAARHLAVAGGKAVGHGDMPAAASLLSRAAGLLEDEHPERPRFLVQAGEALGDIGELAAADEMLAKAHTGAGQLRDEAIAGARAAELARLLLRYTTSTDASAQEGAVARVRELIGVLEDAADHRGLAQAWRLLTYEHWAANKFGLAAESARKMISHATQAGDDLTARRYAGSLAMSVLYGPTPVPEAIRYCEQMLAQETDDKKATALTEVTLAHLQAMRGDFDAARLGYQRSRALLEECGWRLTAALTSLDSGVVEMLAGDLGAAEAELRQDYQTLDKMGERRYIATTAGVLGEVLYRQGRYAESAEFTEICRTLAAPDDVSAQFLWRCVHAKLQARAGDHDGAQVVIAEAVKLIDDSDFLDLQGNGFMDLAEVCRLSGDTGRALEALTLAAARFEAKGNDVSARSAAAAAADLRTNLTVAQVPTTSAGENAMTATADSARVRRPR